MVTVCHSFVRPYSSDITYSQQLHSSRDVSPGNLGYLVSVIPSNAVCSEEEQHSIILLNKSFHILKHFHRILTTCLGSLRIIDKLEHELEHPRISLCSVSSVQKLSSRHWQPNSATGGCILRELIGASVICRVRPLNLGWCFLPSKVA